MSGTSACGVRPVSELLEHLPVIGGYGRWFRERATVFTRFDAEESRRLSEMSGARVRQCYANCARSAYGYDYYEGFAWVLDAMWVEHAFLVRGGVVVDPTLAIGDRLRDGTFFTGMRFDNPMGQAIRLGRFEPLILNEYDRYAEAAKGGPGSG